MKKLIYLAALASITLSCDRFLDVPPESGLVIPSTVEDYDNLLNGGTYTIHTVTNEDIMFLTADDYATTSAKVGNGQQNVGAENFYIYTYSPNRLQNVETGVGAWNDAYQNIYIENKVINEVETSADVTSYTLQDKKRIKAEALYLRALDYSFLVNIFGKHFSTSAGSDPGVPLILQADISQKVPQRSSVDEVYKQMISDLETALPNLPKNRINKTRPSKGSGYALLARLYLYKGDYQKALDNANMALAQKSALSDYTSGGSFRAKYEAEQFSNRYYSYIRGFVNGYLSSDIMNLFSTDDARLDSFFYDDGKGYTNNYAVEINASVSVPEIYLTRAECNARLNNAAAAITDLNLIRKNRINNAAAYTTADFATSKDLLKAVLDERRRELAPQGTRLFDLKRQNLDPALAKTTVHTFDLGGPFTAEPNSPKLVLPIPAQIMKYNPGMTQN